MPLLNDKNFLRFLVKFLGMFAICYGGLLVIIGLSAPGGWYSPFVDHYLNLITWLRASLLWGTKSILAVFGISTYYLNAFVLKKTGGTGIQIIYSCIGYGVMSFWIAFVYANEGGLKQKLKWITGGLLLIWIINIMRLALVLVAANGKFKFPFFDHHTWFNIAAYLAIFMMIFYYNRHLSLNHNHKNEPRDAEKNNSSPSGDNTTANN